MEEKTQWLVAYKLSQSPIRFRVDRQQRIYPSTLTAADSLVIQEFLPQLNWRFSNPGLLSTILAKETREGGLKLIRCADPHPTSAEEL